MNKDNVQKALKEAVDSLYRIQSENDLLSEIGDRMKEEEGIPKAKFNKWAKRLYNNDIEDTLAEAMELKSEIEAFEV